jgi:predicted dehydrogenase
VGLGGRGLHWAKSVAAHPECELVACVEPVEALRERAVERLGLEPGILFSSLSDALDATGADFVIDVTPPAAHRAVAEEAFSRGLHVLGEKPLSDDFDVAREIVRAGERAGRTHMVTQNYRFGGFPRTTRRLLAEGLIGKPGQCDLRFYMPWADQPGSHYVTEPYMVINDMMVHHFDMLRYVLGADPAQVFAVTWNHPWGWHRGDAAHSIVFRYADDLVATHVANGASLGSRTSWNGDWHIEGAEGSIDWTTTELRHARQHRTENKVDEALPLDPVPPQDQAILTEFVSAVREGREPECSGRDNLQSLAMVFAAIRSAREGRWVDLAEFDPRGEG